jgi:hypothetical protein
VPAGNFLACLYSILSSCYMNAFGYYKLAYYSSSVCLFSREYITSTFLLIDL